MLIVTLAAELLGPLMRNHGQLLRSGPRRTRSDDRTRLAAVVDVLAHQVDRSCGRDVAAESSRLSLQLTSCTAVSQLLVPSSSTIRTVHYGK